MRILHSCITWDKSPVNLRIGIGIGGDGGGPYICLWKQRKEFFEKKFFFSSSDSVISMLMPTLMPTPMPTHQTVIKKRKIFLFKLGRNEKKFIILKKEMNSSASALNIRKKQRRMKQSASAPASAEKKGIQSFPELTWEKPESFGPKYIHRGFLAIRF